MSVSVFNVLGGALSGSSLFGSVALGIGSVAVGYIAVKYLGSYFGGIAPRGNAPLITFVAVRDWRKGSNGKLEIENKISEIAGKAVEDVRRMMREENSFDAYGVGNTGDNIENLPDDTSVNAYRHTETSRVTAEKYGTAVSWVLGTSHELENLATWMVGRVLGRDSRSFGTVATQIGMDLHNNAEGRRIAGTSKTTMELLKEGRLRYITSLNNAPTSNGYGKSYNYSAVKSRSEE